MPVGRAGRRICASHALRFGDVRDTTQVRRVSLGAPPSPKLVFTAPAQPCHWRRNGTSGSSASRLASNFKPPRRRSRAVRTRSAGLQRGRAQIRECSGTICGSRASATASGSHRWDELPLTAGLCRPRPSCRRAWPASFVRSSAESLDARPDLVSPGLNRRHLGHAWPTPRTASGPEATSRNGAGYPRVVPQGWVQTSPQGDFVPSGLRTLHHPATWSRQLERTSGSTHFSR
jgi:hypothetical protein